ncbi:MAG: FkbM family methyltransferase [Candidatus Omnitrophica bacterium]|nr:FkbM family methyltransferase [Candidatus Omnitrophota bacterium]
MKIPLPLQVLNNSWAYYLLKYGLMQKAGLSFRTSPDQLKLEFSKDELLSQWEPVKQLLKLIVASEFEYYAAKKEMVIVSAKGERRREKFDLSCIASLRFALDNKMILENTTDKRFFLVRASPNSNPFFVRRANPSDLATVKVVCEEDEYGFLYPYLPGKVVVDVGANIGDTAVLFASKGAALIEAYEIHPVLHDVARRNIELNGLNAKVRLYDCGIGGTDGEMCMRNDSALGPTAGFGSKEARHGQDIRVKLVSMKSVIARLGKIDVLKMDCEGAEFDIFASLAVEDLQKIQVIGLEYHRDPGPLLDKLRSAGFKVEIVTQYTPSLGILLALRF